jgi:S-adenosylmethionine/arginine decarboxylase-like enzyme
MLEHKHIIIRAEVQEPPSDVKLTAEWFKKLVKDIDMKILMGPFVTYLDKEGNRGLTGVCVIETSHMAMHVWDESNPGLLELDVYSCKDFDPAIVMQAIQEFKPTKIEHILMDRKETIKLL